jgi:hypothetical protein
MMGGKEAGIQSFGGGTLGRETNWKTQTWIGGQLKASSRNRMWQGAWTEII